MHIVIVTDAWYPQVNGVVRTLDTLRGELNRQGHRVTMIGPDQFRSVPCPTYPEIRLAMFPDRKLRRLIEAAQPCAIHVATEGPLGWAARHYCRKQHLPFTTAYHSKFPEYIQARLAVPLPVSYGVLRHFHRPASRVMVATPSIERELHQWGITHTARWSRGVDSQLFHPRPACRGAEGPLAGLPRPIFLSVGRLAVEKNLSAFLDLDLPGSKVVVGDGPQASDLRRRYPTVHFAGAKQGEELADLYAASDVFVFPSRTDTFGLVILEALASGLPVAAFPVPGPQDILADSRAGILSEDLRQAAQQALGLAQQDCLALAASYSWQASAGQFLHNLHPFASPPTCGGLLPGNQDAAG